MKKDFPSDFFNKKFEMIEAHVDDTMRKNCIYSLNSYKTNMNDTKKFNSSKFFLSYFFYPIITIKLLENISDYINVFYIQ